MRESTGEGEEWQVFFKTTADRFPELQAHIVARHPWQNPEVTAVEVTSGAPRYVDWVIRVTSQGQSPPRGRTARSRMAPKSGRACGEAAQCGFQTGNITGRNRCIPAFGERLLTELGWSGSA